MVTVCILTFNHEKFVDKCLEACLDQICDFRVEILVHDDASVDETQAILRSYASRYPSIFRLILQDENQYSKGTNPHYGYVLPNATGRYVAFCDGDDFWQDEDKLARQILVLESDPSIALTYGPVSGFDEAGDVTEYQGGVTHDLSANALKGAPPINTLTVVCRNIFQSVPISLYARTSTIGDLTVWAALGYHGSGKYLADLLPAKYRLHGGGLISQQNPDRQQMMSAICYAHIAAFHQEQGDKEAMLRATRSFTSYFRMSTRTGLYVAADEGDFSEAWKYLLRAIKAKFL